MRFTATKPAQRVAVVAALGVGLLTATGCGYINAQQTTHTYSASDGIRADVGTLQLRNMLIVSSGTAGSSSSASADAPGRLVGTVFNSSDKDETLTLKDGSTTTRLNVPKHGEVQLEKSSSPVSLSKTGALPGALATVSFTAGSTSQDVQIPVVDGTLAEYRQYLPTPSATPSGSASASASASSSASASASATASR
ncbi:hypothetical protein RBS60_19110 [Sinomonas sp. ASV486]|uniref:DUF461 domain-containing protein n=1 Tax=Sinomonas puerhi TaxID=3238584 RepID=A0AB39L4P6_9MICC|nr:hypothetical protein [Sinomonas sp. ASV486]MDQ4492312.1 hypothetical protein [Sinomonas sp. ASV486]